jgi:hypothetical protein
MFSGLIVDISGDLDMAQRMSSDVRGIAKAQRRAVGTLRRRLPVVARRDIQQEYNLKAARINQDLRVSTVEDGIKLTGYSRGIGLLNFGARQTRAGVAAEVKKGRRTTYPHAFIAAGLGGNLQVFQRTGIKRRMQKGRYAGRIREAIEALYGPSVAQMLKHGDRPQRIEQAADQIIESELDRQLGPK